MEKEAAQTGTRKVGELAEATGLTVRTLHYYEEIDLLVPSGRTQSGHRLYSQSDVERLYRVCLLRRLGLPLSEIGQALDDPVWNLEASMGTHLRKLERRLDTESRLRTHLVGLLGSLKANKEASTDALLTILEEMTMLDTTVQRRITILVYSDLESAYKYLERVFGLGPGQLTRDDTGAVRHGEIHAGDGVVWLHPESAEFDLASPRSLGAASAAVAVLVDDVDAHFQHARQEGATIVYEPVNQPYGYREYSARDSEGHLWSFMKALD